MFKTWKDAYVFGRGYCALAHTRVSSSSSYFFPVFFQHRDSTKVTVHIWVLVLYVLFCFYKRSSVDYKRRPRGGRSLTTASSPPRLPPLLISRFVFLCCVLPVDPLFLCCHVRQCNTASMDFFTAAANLARSSELSATGLAVSTAASASKLLTATLRSADSAEVGDAAWPRGTPPAAPAPARGVVRSRTRTRTHTHAHTFSLPSTQGSTRGKYVAAFYWS